MESGSSTGKRHQVAICIKNSPPPSSSLNPRLFPAFYSLYTMSLFYLIELALIRMKFEYENKSPFESYGVLMIISIVAIIVALLSGILIFAQTYLKNFIMMRVIRFSILEAICFFSGTLSTLSLLLVLFPENLIWVGYLVVFLVFAIAGACYWFFPKEKDVEARIQQDKISINYSMMIAPLPMVLMLHVPDSFNWIKLWVIGATLVFVVAYNGIANIKSINKKKVHSLEACQMIQSNKITAKSSFE